MAQYRLYTGGPYKQNNGSAITSSSTDINVGAAKYTKDGDILNRTENSTQEQGVPGVVGGVDGVASGDWDSMGTVNVDSIAEGVNGMSLIDASTSHGLVVGQLVRIDDQDLFPNQVYRVLSVPTADQILVNAVFDAEMASITELVMFKSSGDIANMDAGNYAMRKVVGTVHGETSLAPLTSGSSDYGRSKVHKTNAVRTRKVATAIREGRYDFVSGDFDAGYPTEANDFTGMDTDGSNVPDDETKSTTGKREVGGELTFKSGGAPTTTEYPAKTT